MVYRDEILVGDGTIGNYVVGFFDCQADDGENAETAILKAYRNLGYWNVKPIYDCDCLDAVQHEGLNELMMTPEGWYKAYTFAIGSTEKYLRSTSEAGLSLERAEKVRLHRHQVP